MGFASFATEARCRWGCFSFLMFGDSDLTHSFLSETLEGKIFSGNRFAELALCDLSVSKVVDFVNPFSYGIIVSRPDILDGIDMWFVDGSLLCCLRNLAGREYITRASFDFSSIAGLVFEWACRNEKRVAFVGATKDEIQRAARNLVGKFPLLNVVYVRDGYLEASSMDGVVSEIDGACVDIVVIGMGCPFQEVFALECKRSLTRPTLIFTCGGFFTQTAARVDYYHPIVKRMGLRWLQRAVQYPHVRQRLLRDYPRFIVRYVREVLLPLRFRR